MRLHCPEHRLRGSGAQVRDAATSQRVRRPSPEIVVAGDGRGSSCLDPGYLSAIPPLSGPRQPRMEVVSRRPILGSGRGYPPWAVEAGHGLRPE